MIFNYGHPISHKGMNPKYRRAAKELGVKPAPTFVFLGKIRGGWERKTLIYVDRGKLEDIIGQHSG